MGLERKQRGVRRHEARASNSAMGSIVMSHNCKKKSKFSPQQIKFLEVYFSGFTIKDAARAAGYRGSSASALCNTGRAILTKYEQSGIFRGTGASEARIASLLVDMVENNQSESDRLKGLTILSKAMFSRR